MKRPSALHSAALEFAAISVRRAGAAARLPVSTNQTPVRALLTSISVVPGAYTTRLPSGDAASSDTRSRRTRSCTVKGCKCSAGAPPAAVAAVTVAAVAAAPRLSKARAAEKRLAAIACSLWKDAWADCSPRRAESAKSRSALRKNMRMNAPLVLSFDLDDTLWPVGPVLAAAESELLSWLRARYPLTVSGHGIESMRALR